MDIDALFEKEAFRKIDPERLQIFRSFAAEINGKKPMEAMSIFVKFSQALPGKPLSDSEKNAIIQAISESLPESEQGKLKMFLSALSNT